MAAGHDKVDWTRAPEGAKAWAVDSKGDAHWLHWDVEDDHFDDGSWVQPGRTDTAQPPLSSPADRFDWDSTRDWRDSLTFRP